MGCSLCFLLMLPQLMLLSTASDVISHPEMATLDVRPPRLRRQAVASDHNLWPHGQIVYTLSNLLLKDVRSRAAITNAIAHWQNVTCIRFTYRPMEELDPIDKYIIFKGGFKCASPVGMTSGAWPQILEIHRSCAYEAMIVHELGHAIGLWHEHTRPDRDAHVLVVWKNVKVAAMHNFDMQRAARLLTPYDLYSVMHYEPKMFSKNTRLTLRTLDPRLQSMLGRHTSLSHYDVMTASLLYKCAANCSSAPRCENDGFMTSSCACRCPRGLTGSRCHLVESDEDCGGVLKVSNGTTLQVGATRGTTLQGRRCLWLLRGVNHSLITLRVVSADLSKNQRGECTDELEIRYHSIGVPEGYALCKNKKTRNETFRSVDDKMIVHYSSDGVNVESGFSAIITLQPREDCASSPCRNGAHCDDAPEINTYICACPTGWLGKNCQVPILDGGWSAWGPWSSCSTRCGQSSRTRMCNSPKPLNGGKGCSGVAFQTRKCGARECEGFFSCDFGTQRFPDLCGLVPGDAASSALEWTLTSGKTPSPRTGPSGGHTDGGRGDMYYFLEASHGRKFQKAISWYRVREPAGHYCLEFYYNMYGSYIATLAIVGRDVTSGVNPATLWQMSGNQGRDWRVARIDLHLRPGMQLGFVATKGETYKGDMALDDISLSPGLCVPSARYRPTKLRGCVYQGRRVPLGKTFSDRSKCTTCFCNQDGRPDCPSGPVGENCARAQGGPSKAMVKVNGFPRYNIRYLRYLRRRRA